MEKESIEWLKEVKFDEENGEVRILGQRHTIVDPVAFKNIRDKMLQLIGPAADTILYLSAKNHTIYFVSSVLRKSILAKFAQKFKWGREKIAEKLCHILTFYGYGKANLEKIDFEKESIITLKNSCIGTLYHNQEKPVCSYIAGLIAGAAVAITGEDYDCEEVECVGKGDKYCKFVVKKAKKA